MQEVFESRVFKSCAYCFRYLQENVWQNRDFVVY